MTTANIGALQREHPSPKRSDPSPRGRKTGPLRVTVTRAQEAALQARAQEQGCTVSEIVRRFVADGLAAPVTAQSDDGDS